MMRPPFAARLALLVIPVIPVMLVMLVMAASLSTSHAANRPNIVFIISDDLAASALSCYGNPDCRTPAIDALAGRGLRFTRAYCQFPVCGPSRAALMSGLYPQAIGVTGNGSSGQFAANLGDRPSLSQHFIRNGYYAARVSKIYHMRVPGDITAGVNGPDHAPSWTERFNCRAPEWMSEGEAYQLTNHALNFDRERHYNLGFGSAFYVVKSAGDGSEQPDVRAADKAIELMEEHRNDPFFLAVGMVRPHVPLVAPAAFHASCPPDTMTLAEQRDGDTHDIPKAGISMHSKGAGLEAADAQRRVLSAYYASVAFMDAQVGRIIAALDRLQLRERTIVVFTSDHGYHLGEHGLWQKMSLHEESTRIPLILSVPGSPAAETAALAEQIDIFPTLSELAGIPVPGHCQGISLANLVHEPGLKPRDAIYCLRGNAHLIRTESFALLSYPDGTAELYDMVNDPRQFTNLIGDPDYDHVLANMRARLEKKLRTITATH